MVSAEFNHVTIYADDVEALVTFYQDVFGLEEIQSPNLGNPLSWLRCGDLQLHIVNRETESPQYHHFALAVDDFEHVFRCAQEQDLFDDVIDPTPRPSLYLLPDGVVQMYIRDPAGNLVEVDWPDETTLDDSIREHIIDRSEEHTQTKAQSEARLFLDQ